MHKILIVEDKKSMLDMLVKAFRAEGLEVQGACNLNDALSMLSPEISAIVTDIKLPDGDGLDVLRRSKTIYPFIPIIVMTAYGSIETAVKAVKEGAYDFITKPFDPEHMIHIVKRAIEEKGLLKENIALKREFNRYLKMPELIGVSRQWGEVIEKIKKIAPLKTTVLILGESGTGKELLARAIHYLSPRAKEPFIAINCAAIPKDLIESEIFGHEKGAFTGASDFKQGRFELADRGTIFLDEIGDMEKPLQAKLLRVLQESEFERIGGTKTIKIDVRILAASNKDLEKEVLNGNFREDLFYRLNVFPIKIPPLRERKEDIIPLAEYFLNLFSKEINKPNMSLSSDAKEMLLNYEWKGNIRELRNVIERAVILCESGEIHPEHLNLVTERDEKIYIDASLHDIATSAAKTVERAKIQEALRVSKGNKSKAAEILKVSYKTLLNKIKEYKISISSH